MIRSLNENTGSVPEASFLPDHLIEVVIFDFPLSDILDGINSSALVCPLFLLVTSLLVQMSRWLRTAEY